MSELPEGWSIEAYGTDVVVRVPRTTHTEHMLNHVEARILGRYLYAAALTADRARLRAIEDTASGPSVK